MHTSRANFYLLSDIVSNLTDTVCCCAFGMDNTLGDSFACKVGKLVNQVEILNEDRSSGTGG